MSSHKKIGYRHPVTQEWFRPIVMRIETTRADGRPDNLTAFYDEDRIALSEDEPEALNNFAVVLGSEKTFPRVATSNPQPAPPKEMPDKVMQPVGSKLAVPDTGDEVYAFRMSSSTRAAMEALLTKTGDPEFKQLLIRALSITDALYKARENGERMVFVDAQGRHVARFTFWLPVDGVSQ